MSNRYGLSEHAFRAALAAFQAGVSKLGGQNPTANVCRCTQGNISQLIQRGSLLPGRYVLKMEAATGIPRSDFRPDIYPRTDGDAPNGDYASIALLPQGVGSNDAAALPARKRA